MKIKSGIAVLCAAICFNSVATYSDAVTEGRFNPDGKITRQEASRMLYMATTTGERFPEIGKDFSEKVNEMNSSSILPHIFRDGFKIKNRAQESVTSSPPPHTHKEVGASHRNGKFGSRSIVPMH